MLLGPPEPKFSSLLLLGAGPSGGAPYVLVAPVNNTPPEITGVESLGHVVGVASVGVWSHAPTSFSYQWYRQPGATGPFEEIVGANSFEMSLTSEDIGAMVRCEVVASNAAGDSAPAVSNGLGPIAAGDAPANGEAPAITGSPTEGEELTCSEGTWDHAPASFEYQWQRDEGDGFENLPNTTAVHACAEGDVGFLLRCIVTAINEFGSDSAASNNVGPIAPGNVPANTEAPAISGSPILGEELTCNEGAWNYGPVSFEYQWQRNEGEGFEDISDTLNAHVCSAGDVGFMLRCIVSATNEYGSNAAASNGVGPVAGGHAPANTEAPALSGVPTAGEVLTCSEGSWDHAPTSFAYQWQRDEGMGFEDIANTTNNHLCEVDDVDFMLRCVVTATNEFGDGSADSNSVGPIDDGLSEDTSLAVFTINGVSPTGDTFNLPYYHAGLLLSELAIECTPTHPMATVGEMLLNPDPLELGTDSELAFDVTAEDGDTVQPYVFIVHVMNEGTGEVTDITAVADVGASLHGTYFFMSRASETVAVLLDAARPAAWSCTFGSSAGGPAFNTFGNGRWLKFYIAPFNDVVFWGNTGSESTPSESASTYVEVAIGPEWDSESVCGAFQSAISSAGFTVNNMGGGVFSVSPPGVGPVTAPTVDASLWDVSLSVAAEGREHAPEVGGYTNVVVPFQENNAASDLALAMATFCDGLGWNVAASGDVATFSDSNFAARTDASDGGIPTGFTITVIQQGADPA